MSENNNSKFVIKKYDSHNRFDRPGLTDEETEQLMQEMKEVHGLSFNFNHFYIHKVLSFVLDNEHSDISKISLAGLADEINIRLAYPQCDYCSPHFLESVLNVALCTGQEKNPDFSLKDISFENFEHAQDKYNRIKKSYLESLEDNTFFEDTQKNMSNSDTIQLHMDNMLPRSLDSYKTSKFADVNNLNTQDVSTWDHNKLQSVHKLSLDKLESQTPGLEFTDFIKEKLKQLRATPDNPRDKNKFNK